MGLVVLCIGYVNDYYELFVMCILYIILINVHVYIVFPISITRMSQIEIFYLPSGSLPIIEFDNVVKKTEYIHKSVPKANLFLSLFRIQLV